MWRRRYDPCPATGAFDMQVQLQVFHEPKNAASILVDCMPDQHFARSPNQTTVAVRRTAFPLDLAARVR